MEPYKPVAAYQHFGSIAFAIVQRLETRGIDVWIAPRDVSPSVDWAAEIIDAIAAARLML